MKKFLQFLQILMAALSGDPNQYNEVALSTVKITYGNVLDSIFNDPEFELLYNVILPVGVVAAVLFLALDLIEKVSMQNFNLEILILNLSKIVFVIAVVNNGPVIVEGFVGVMTRILERLSQALIGTRFQWAGMELESVQADPGGLGGWLKMIIFVLTLLDFSQMFQRSILMMQMSLVFLTIPIMAYTWAIRVGLHTLMIPLAAADVSGHGISGTKTFRYLMRILKLLLEYPIIFIGVLMASELIFSIYNANNPFNIFGTNLELQFICFFVLQKTIFSAKTYVQNMFV